MIQSLNFESEISDEDVTAFVKLIFNKKNTYLKQDKYIKNGFN